MQKLLAAALLIPRQFAQQLVNELHVKGFTQQALNRAHKRSWLIQLTPEGLQAFRQIKKREISVIKAVARDLAASDVEACLHVLTHLSASFGAIADVGQPERSRGLR